MARGSAQFNRDFRRWQADLGRAVKPETFHKIVRDKHLLEIVNAIIGSAKAGIGPDNERYPEYSKSYEKTKAKKAIQLWLSQSGNMLDRKRFNLVVRANSGSATLTWEGPVYGPVHQGKAYGGTGYAGNSKYPERPWFHVQNPTNRRAVITAYELAKGDIADKFNAGSL